MFLCSLFGQLDTPWTTPKRLFSKPTIKAINTTTKHSIIFTEWKCDKGIVTEEQKNRRFHAHHWIQPAHVTKTQVIQCENNGWIAPYIQDWWSGIQTLYHQKQEQQYIPPSGPSLLLSLWNTINETCLTFCLSDIRCFSILPDISFWKHL